MDLSTTIVSILICVVLPVSIVLIVFLAVMNSDNKRAKVLIKAIEANGSIDVDKIAESLKKNKKTALELLNLRLLRGCIFSFVGLVLGIVSWVYGGEFDAGLFGGISLAIGASYLVVYFVTRKQGGNSDDK